MAFLSKGGMKIVGLSSNNANIVMVPPNPYEEILQAEHDGKGPKLFLRLLVISADWSEIPK